MNKKYASIRHRLLGIFYEGLLITGILFIATYLFLAVFNQAQVGWKHYFFQGYLFFIMGIYFIYFWSYGRQTLAMKTWRLSLVSTAGLPLNYKQAFYRYLSSW